MKVPQMFRLEGDLEGKTEELLGDMPKKSITLDSSNRIHYCFGDYRWYLEYGLPKHEDEWVLAGNYELSEKAKEIISKMLEPVVDLLNLRKSNYSLEKDNARKILDRYTTRFLRRSKKVEDEKYGSGKATFYKRGNVIIELREFDEIDFGIVKPA